MNKITEEIVMALDDIYKLDDSPSICDLLDVIKSRIEILDIALSESVKLQSHYAELLNIYDHGERITFNADGWLDRLEKIKIIKFTAHPVPDSEDHMSD